jgi:hypothetical protein
VALKGNPVRLALSLKKCKSVLNGLAELKSKGRVLFGWKSVDSFSNTLEVVGCFTERRANISSTECRQIMNPWRAVAKQLRNENEFSSPSAPKAVCFSGISTRN